MTAPAALLFDTFGTVVDWRGSIVEDFRAFGAARGVDVDWGAFVDEWKTAYRPGMEAVRTGAWPWTRVEGIYERKLGEILPKFGLDGLTESERRHLNRVWHRLNPWPDACAGLRRLKTRHVISPLSNGDVDCLVGMARHADLPWDVILCAELFRHYKPDAEVYLGAIDYLGLRAEQVMMVAAHNYDLAAAHALGLRTAFVPRPTEYGPGQTTDLAPASDWDIVAEDFAALATALKC